MGRRIIIGAGPPRAEQPLITPQEVGMANKRDGQGRGRAVKQN
jgi:hypothetical protein